MRIKTGYLIIGILVSSWGLFTPLGAIEMSTQNQPPIMPPGFKIPEPKYENKVAINNGLVTILRLKPYRFDISIPAPDGKSPVQKRTASGFFADDVSTVAPELVVDLHGAKLVDDRLIVSLLVKAIQELKAEKDQEIKLLQSEIQKLRADLGK